MLCDGSITVTGIYNDACFSILFKLKPENVTLLLGYPKNKKTMAFRSNIIRRQGSHIHFRCSCSLQALGIFVESLMEARPSWKPRSSPTQALVIKLYLKIQTLHYSVFEELERAWHISKTTRTWTTIQGRQFQFPMTSMAALPPQNVVNFSSVLLIILLLDSGVLD